MDETTDAIEKQENHDLALAELRNSAKDLRAHMKKARDVVSYAMEHLESLLGDLPEGLEMKSEQELLEALADAFPGTYRRHSDEIDDSRSDLRIAFDKLMHPLGETLALRDYISAGDFSK